MSVTLHTTHGDLKIELFCQAAPLASKNFLGLAAASKYDGIAFHRIMATFLIQGGDTTNTGGKGGETIYDVPFPCEFSPELSHNKRGIVGMATKPKEPNQNLSQFYIIFSPQEHLDQQSTVFGKVIDGFDVLDLLEGVVVDAKYRPVENVAINTVTIHSNPFAEQEKS
jgi:peptidyl-prolyl cis-trans isomerase-like 3